MNCPISELHLTLQFHLAPSHPCTSRCCLHSVVQTTGEKWKHGKPSLAQHPERMGVTERAQAAPAPAEPGCFGDDSFQEPALLPVIKEGVNPCSFGHKVDV